MWISFKTYSKLETRTLADLESILELAKVQLQQYLAANESIPASRYGIFKARRLRFEQQIQIVENVIACLLKGTANAT